MPLEVDVDKIKELAAGDDPAAVLAYITTAHDRDVDGLKRKTGELLGTIKDLEGLKAYKNLGKSPEEIQAELAEARKIREEMEAKGKGVSNEEVEKLAEERVQRKIGTIKTEWETKLGETSKALQEREELAAKLQAELHSERLETRLVRIAGDVVYPEAWDDFKQHVGKHIQWDDAGKPTVIDPESGVSMAGKAGGNMTLEELIEDVARKRKFYFKPQGNGSPLGKDPGRRGLGGFNGTLKRSAMSNAQKSAYIREHGEEAFRAIPE